MSVSQKSPKKGFLTSFAQKKQEQRLNPYFKQPRASLLLGYVVSCSMIQRQKSPPGALIRMQSYAELTPRTQKNRYCVSTVFRTMAHGLMILLGQAEGILIIGIYLGVIILLLPSFSTLSSPSFPSFPHKPQTSGITQSFKLSTVLEYTTLGLFPSFPSIHSAKVFHSF